MLDEPKAIDAARCARLLPQTSPDANKYTRGMLVVAAGSQDYPGAAVLAAIAASRSGAGYVRLCTPQPAVAAARAHLCSVPVTECDAIEGAFAQNAVSQVLQAATKAKALVVGPGLTTRAQVGTFLRDVLAGFEGPVVLDADALNIIAAQPDMLAAREGRVSILTPHDGEAARLLGRSVNDRLADAHMLAERFGATVVLKGPRTLVVGPKTPAMECTAGGPELAKAGTGDVLSGMTGAFAAQGLGALEAAALAVYLHARAGALAAAERGQLSVIPEDVVERIGQAAMSLADEFEQGV